MSTTATDALRMAAEASLRAPSIFNTQPWRWHFGADFLELYADPDRQLPVVDPDRRLTTLSCGIALHHARTALAAEGHTDEVSRLPDPGRPDLLAHIRTTGRSTPRPADIRRYAATLTRHTNRRLFTNQRVPAEALDRLLDVAEGQGIHLYVLQHEDTTALVTAVSHAQDLQMANPAYRAELAHWTRQLQTGGDCVPADTVTAPVRHRVPVRNFGVEECGGLNPGTGFDQEARYAVLAGNTDEPASWLRAGEALSAVLLTAVDEGLAVSPINDVAEVPSARAHLSEMLGGIENPFLALQIGVAESVTGVPATPRRDPADATEFDR
ncbi:MAG: nitroreductase [Dactylosporangium sp.]|jgi:hypothetical protein|nr:nitroreductase [Dactylosporangium sp.]